MSEDSKSNQVAPATNEPINENDVVFVTILRKDRDWINGTKGKLNRKQRLHEIIESDKKIELARTYEEDGDPETAIKILLEFLKSPAATPSTEALGAVKEKCACGIVRGDE